MRRALAKVKERGSLRSAERGALLGVGKAHRNASCETDPKKQPQVAPQTPPTWVKGDAPLRSAERGALLGVGKAHRNASCETDPKKQPQVAPHGEAVNASSACANEPQKASVACAPTA